MLQNFDIILVRPQQSGNVGSVARSISNHGFRKLVLVDPPHLDIEHARWMAPHARQVIDETLYVSDVQQSVASSHLVFGTTARRRSWDIPHLELQDFLELIYQKVQKSPKIRISLVFGPEDSGLSNQDLSFCQYTVALPTVENASLNLGQAVNVFGSQILHYFCEKEIVSDIDEHENVSMPISQKIFHSITERALAILGGSGYLDAKNPLQIRHQILRFLSQSNLSNKDMAIVSGMTNKIYHKLRILGHIEDDTQK